MKASADLCFLCSAQAKPNKKKGSDFGLTNMFKDQDLEALGVPPAAWPKKDGVYKGSKSYTVSSPSGAAIWIKSKHIFRF